jgi:hypothetical protein
MEGHWDTVVDDAKNASFKIESMVLSLINLHTLGQPYPDSPGQSERSVALLSTLLPKIGLHGFQ